MYFLENLWITVVIFFLRWANNLL